jgi:hypothetical protein
MKEEIVLRCENSFCYDPQLSPPRVRSECVDSIRPCPWIRCRYHLIWAILDRDCRINNKYRHNTRHDILEDYSDDVLVDLITSMPQSCVLDIADRTSIAKRPLSHQGIARMIGLSYQRVQQIESGSVYVKGYLPKLRVETSKP